MNLSIHENYYKFCPACKTELQRKSIDGRRRFFCPGCDFIFWNNPKPVVSILISKKNEILMLQRANEPLKNYWCLPGGYVNYDETPEEALTREVKEELGKRISIDGLIGVYRIDNDPRGINIDIIYKGRIKGEINLSIEHQDYRFFGPDQLPKKIAYKHRQAINDWLNNKFDQRLDKN